VVAAGVVDEVVAAGVVDEVVAAGVVDEVVAAGVVDEVVAAGGEVVGGYVYDTSTTQSVEAFAIYPLLHLQSSM